MKLKLIKASVLSTTIATIGSQRVQLDADIQAAAIQCVGQSIVHRNVTPAIALFDALGKSTRRDSLVKFFERYGNIAWLQSDKKLAFHDGNRKFDDEAIALMSKNMWYDAKKEPEISSIYDVEKEVEKFLDRCKKAVGDKGRKVEHGELYTQLRNVYLRYVVETAPQDVKDAHTPENTPVPEHNKTAEFLAESAAQLQDHFGQPQVKAA